MSSAICFRYTVTSARMYAASRIWFYHRIQPPVDVTRRGNSLWHLRIAPQHMRRHLLTVLFARWHRCQRNRAGTFGLERSGSRLGAIIGPCVYRNEPVGRMKDTDFMNSWKATCFSITMRLPGVIKLAVRDAAGGAEVQQELIVIYPAATLKCRK
jgi:hypothetical protein